MGAYRDSQQSSVIQIVIHSLIRELASNQTRVGQQSDRVRFMSGECKCEKHGAAFCTSINFLFLVVYYI